MSSVNWIWSADHHDYYRQEFQAGQWVTIFSKQSAEQGQDSYPTFSSNDQSEIHGARDQHHRIDSGYSGTLPQNIYQHFHVAQTYPPYASTTGEQYPPRGQAQDDAAQQNVPQANAIPHGYQNANVQQDPTPRAPPSQHPQAPYTNNPIYPQNSATLQVPNPNLNSTPNPNSIPTPRRGLTVHGTYVFGQGGPHFEDLDSSFYVRASTFFREGKVFAVLFTEAAGSTATSYNSSISFVKYNERVHSQIRRFIVVRARKEFCFACPIFTYSGRGTTKNGVRPEEHAIAYSSTEQARPFAGEDGMMSPICIENAENIQPLDPASRIYFGIHHPIQYNVKVQDVGDVHPRSISFLRGHWNKLNKVVTNQGPEVAEEE